MITSHGTFYQSSQKSLSCCCWDECGDRISATRHIDRLEESLRALEEEEEEEGRKLLQHPDSVISQCVMELNKTSLASLQSVYEWTYILFQYVNGLTVWVPVETHAAVLCIQTSNRTQL